MKSSQTPNGRRIGELESEVSSLTEKNKGLVEALARVEDTCLKPGMEDPFKDGWRWFYGLQEALSAYKEVRK